MPATRYRGPPMTLANMRHNGVRSLSIRCELCHHEAVLNVDTYDEQPRYCPSARAWCTCCAIIGADARPNWSERPQSESLTGWQWR